MRSIRHWLRGLLAASSLFAGVAAAQSYDHSVYLDLDNNTATGCNIATAAGPVNGAEVRLTATVTGTPPMVTGSTRAQCAGGVFGAAQPISGTYAVGLNNGIGGSDVVELGTVLAGLGQGGTVRVTFVSTSAGGADLASGLVQLPGGGVLAPAAPILVPATGIIALLAIVGLVLILARRHPAFGSSVVLLLLLGAGVVWAANFVVDGQVGDWTGVPPLTADPNNDSTSSDSHIEIVSVFAATEAGSLFLRVDVLDAQAGGNAAPVLGDTAFGVAENSANATAVGTVTATDADAGQTLTYSITAGNASGAFAINAATGAITVANASQLDFETTASYLLTVSVSDNGTPPLSDTAAVTINLTNVNEAPVLADATRAVAEDSAVGTPVGAPLGGTDPDAGATLTYAITAGNTNGAFAIDNAGQLTVANAAEVSTTGTFTLTVTLTDNGGLSDTATITVNVSDQNDAPTFTGEPYAFTLAENSVAATVVGSTPATDTDAGQTLTWAITAGNTGGAFAIDAAGQITVANAAAIDFETNPAFTLTVTVTDDGGTPMSDTASVAITLTDVNEAPVLADATRAVAEDSAAGTPVGAPLGGTDPDTGATLTYAITAGNTGGAFAIDNAGQLTVASAPEVATIGTFTLTVTLTDNGGLTDTATITVNVTDQNDAPIFTGEPFAFTLAENSAAATVVGSAPATDTDAGQTLSWAITVGNTGGAFAIDAAGQITVANAAAVDFEANPSFSLTVTATDDGAPPMSDTTFVTITLTDVNETPTVADAAFAVAENAAAGTTVGSVFATDPDLDPPNPPSPNATLSFAITAGNTGNVFAIDANTGVITTAAAPVLADSPYTLTVTVTDGGALSDTATITITVTDQNDAPTLNDATFPLAENSTAGTAVGTVTATDPDLGQTFTYAITAGNGAGGFAIDANTGAITVANSAALDFETTPTFVLTVSATDNGAPPLADTATVTINLSDVNDPPVASDIGFTVAENSADGTVVGTYAATDQDAGQTLSYAITGGADAALFAIGAASGQITVANSAGLDFESDVVRLLQITATDDGAGNLTDVATVLVTLTDVNEAPVANDANFSVAEDSPNGTPVGTVLAADQDAGANGTLTYAITAGNTNGAFAIDANTGAVTVANQVEIDAGASFSLTVTVTDGGALSDTAAVAVSVDDVNEAPVPTAMPSATPSLPENSATGTLVATIVPNDPEGLQTHTFAIIAGNTGGAFAIDAAGALTVAVSPDFEAGPTGYVLDVQVTDNGVPPLSGTVQVTVTITDVNESPAFTSPAAASTAEGSTAVLTVTTTDPENDTITYAVAGGVDAGFFSIDPGTGVLTFTVAPDFDAPADSGADNVYDVIVSAADGTNTPTQAIAVTVTNINDAPVFTSANTANVPENTTVAITVTATDADVADTVTYSITGGADAALFTINGASGALAFLAAPDFEAPTDAGTNNVYDVVVTASDGTASPTQAIALTVTNANEAPTVTSPNAFSVPENTMAVGTVTTADPEGNTVTYSISGGADALSFAIDTNTGALSFAVAPDFEAPVDAGANNVYDVQVTATDGSNPVPQNIAVTVTDVDEPASFTSSATPSAPENQTAVTTVVATDPEGATMTYSISGGADAGFFSIDSGSGVLTFLAAPNFEAPADAGADNTYLVDVTATDGSNPIVQNLTVTVTNVNEAPVLADQARNIDENSANGTPVGAALAITDPDAGSAFTFSITAGNASGAFAIDNNGQITVADVTDLNFEVTPSFTLTVSASDNGVPVLGDTATVSVTINNVNEAPTAVADAYNYIGNTELRVDGHAGTANALAFTTETDNPLDNDTDPDTLASGFANLSVVAVSGGTSANGGRYDLLADGTMRYTPPAGFTGADSITYQLTDGTNTVNGTLGFTMSGTDVVWYVRNNDPTSDGASQPHGTSSYPFNTLAAASTASQPNHIVYVHAGDGTTTGQNSGIVLKNGQKLWGQGIALDVNGGTTLIAAGAQPQIGNSGGVGVTAVNLSNVQVRGLNIAGNTDAIAASTTAANSGSIEISDNTIRAAGAQGINLDGGGTGTFTVSLHDLSLTTTGTAIDINRTAGTVLITAFEGLTVSGNTAGSGIVVTAASFDATPPALPLTTIDAGLVAIGSLGNGVGGAGMVLTNVQGDLHFSNNLTVFADGGTGLGVSGTGGGMTLRVATAGPATGTVQATGAPAVDASAVALDLRLVDLRSTNSATTGVSLTNVTGTFTAPASSQITNATGTDFAISGGTATVTYQGTITDDVGQLVSVSGATAGTKLFEGAISDGNDGDGSGISLTGNTGAVIQFRGGLLLSTGANAAFTATGGGTVSVCDENSCNFGATGSLVNTLTTTSGTALNVANTNIGAAGLEFRSISANGAVNGIVVNNTGALGGGLKVSGNSSGTCGGTVTVNPVGTAAGVGAPTLADCTGGTIQATTGAAIVLTNTDNVSLTRMRVINPATDGLQIADINGFTLANSHISDSAGAAGDRGIEIGDFITGTPVNGNISITNSHIGPTPHDNVAVGISSGTSTWTISGSVLEDSQTNSGLNFEIRNATVSAFTISGSVFQSQFADGLQFQPAAGVNANLSQVTIQNSTFLDNNIGMDLNHDGTSTVNYDVLANTFLEHVAQPINLFSSAVQPPATGGTLSAAIDGNRIGNSAVGFSGSDIGNGIRVNINGGADGTVAVTNNIVRQTPNGRGLEVISRNGTGGLDITVTGNTVDNDFVATFENGGFSLSSMFLQSNCLTVCNTLRTDVRNNTVPAVAPTGELLAGQIALIETGGSTLQLVDSTAPISGTCASELAATNTGNVNASATCSLIPGPISTPP